jgi:hypothetical protein
VPNAARTPNRVVRVSDDVWSTAAKKAQREGLSMIELVRKLLADYAGMKGATGVMGRADRESS